MIKKEFDQGVVEEINRRLDLVIEDYTLSNDLEYLRDTLKEIQNNIQRNIISINQLITDKKYEGLDLTHYISLLQNTFIEFNWKVEKTNYGKGLIALLTGSYKGIEIEVRYYNTYNNFSVSMNFPYKDETIFSPYVEGYYSTIEEVITEIKETLITLKESFNSLVIN